LIGDVTIDFIEVRNEFIIVACPDADCANA